MFSLNPFKVAGAVFALSCVMLGTTPASAQSDNPLGNILGGFLGAITQQAAKAEWEKLAPAKLQCMELGFKSQNTSIQNLIKGGVKPSDNRLAPYHKICDSVLGRQLRTNFDCSLKLRNGGTLDTKCDEKFVTVIDGKKQNLEPTEAMAVMFKGGKVSVDKSITPEALAEYRKAKERKAAEAARKKQEERKAAEAKRLAEEAERKRIAEEAEAKRLAEEKLARETRLKLATEAVEKDKTAFAVSKLFDAIEEGADVAMLKKLYAGCEAFTSVTPATTPPSFVFKCPLTDDEGKFLVAQNANSDVDVQIKFSAPRAGISKVTVSSQFPNYINDKATSKLAAYDEFGCQGGLASTSTSAYANGKNKRARFAAVEFSSGNGGDWGTLTIATSAEQLQDLGKDWYASCSDARDAKGRGFANVASLYQDYKRRLEEAERKRLAEEAERKRLEKIAQDTQRTLAERKQCKPKLEAIGFFKGKLNKGDVAKALSSDTSRSSDAYKDALPYILAGAGKYEEVEAALSMRIANDARRWRTAAEKRNLNAVADADGAITALRENCYHELADYLVANISLGANAETQYALGKSTSQAGLNLTIASLLKTMPAQSLEQTFAAKAITSTPRFIAAALKDIAAQEESQRAERERQEAAARAERERQEAAAREERQKQEAAARAERERQQSAASSGFLKNLPQCNKNLLINGNCKTSNNKYILQSKNAVLSFCSKLTGMTQSFQDAWAKKFKTSIRNINFIRANVKTIFRRNSSGDDVCCVKMDTPKGPKTDTIRSIVVINTKYLAHTYGIFSTPVPELKFCE